MRGDSLNFIKRLKEFIHYLETDIRGECTIPYEELEMVARCLFPDIVKFFENKENLKRYEQWKSENSDSAHLTKQAV